MKKAIEVVNYSVAFFVLMASQKRKNITQPAAQPQVVFPAHQ